MKYAFNAIPLKLRDMEQFCDYKYNAKQDDKNYNL